jgi:putative copper export protein
LRAVVTPTVPAGAGVDAQFGGRRAAWAMWVGIATLLLLASGLFNYNWIISAHEKMEGGYHALAGTKILLALALFFVAALLAGRSPAAERMRRNMRAWLGLCLILGIAILILGAMLRAVPRTPKASAIERNITAELRPDQAVMGE